MRFCVNVNGCNLPHYLKLPTKCNIQGSMKCLLQKTEVFIHFLDYDMRYMRKLWKDVSVKEINGFLLI